MSKNPETEALNQAYNRLELLRWENELIGWNPVDILDFTVALKKLPKSEQWAAEAIAKKFKNIMKYNPDMDQWYFWNGRIHKPCVKKGLPTKVVKIFYQAMCGSINRMEERIGAIASTATDPEKKKKELRGLMFEHVKLRDALSTVKGQNSMVKMLETELDIDKEHFSNDTQFFVVQNGVFDMDRVRETKQFDLLPHDPSRPVYREWHFVDNPGSDHSALDHFLSTSLEDASQGRFLQKILGTAVFGTRPEEGTRSIVSLQGAPRSGKSMMLRILNEFSDTDTFIREPQSSAIVYKGKNPEHGRNPMKEARVSAFTEITERLERGFLLKYSGGDRCTSEDKYIKNTAWYPQGVIFLFSNHGVNVDKSDPAMFGRLKPINFPFTFEPEALSDGVHILDPKLQDKIVAQGSGFLEWLKKGFLAGLEEDFACSESMEALKRQERDDEDEVAMYLEDRIETGIYAHTPGLVGSRYVRVGDAYADFKLWHGQKWTGNIMKRATFSERMNNYYPLESIDASGKKKAFIGLEKTDGLSV